MGIVNVVGYVGGVSGVAVTVAYSASVSTSPEYPWSPPPKSDSTLLAFARSSCFSRFSVLLVGAPWMGVGVLYLKYDAALSTATIVIVEMLKNK